MDEKRKTEEGEKRWWRGGWGERGKDTDLSLSLASLHVTPVEKSCRNTEAFSEKERPRRLCPVAGQQRSRDAHLLESSLSAVLAEKVCATKKKKKKPVK